MRSKLYNIITNKYTYLYVFVAVLPIALIPIIIFADDLLFDKAQYATEWIKTIITILTIVFSLSLTLILETYRERKNKIRRIVDKIEIIYISSCNDLIIELESVQSNPNNEISNKANLFSSNERLSKLKVDLEEINYHLNDSNSNLYAQLIYDFEKNSKKLNFFIKDIIEGAQINSDDLNDNLTYLKSIFEKLNKINLTIK